MYLAPVVFCATYLLPCLSSRSSRAQGMLARKRKSGPPFKALANGSTTISEESRGTGWNRQEKRNRP